MKIEFLIKKPENTRLILLFAGWSAGPEIGKEISLKGWDVAVVHDFSDLSLDCGFLDNYYTVYLFAWSLGVFAASSLLPGERITAAFAINGTESPVSDSLGIPASIYTGTEAGLDEKNLKKFRLRMAGDRETFARMGECAGSVESLRLQLAVVREAATQSEASSSIEWVRAYISKNDRIFPPDNMLRFWSAKRDVDIVRLEAPHYVSLKMIVSNVISDPDTVSKKFSRASVSYDTHAIAQYSAAIKLASRLADMEPAKEGSYLEIGCGTGLFTHEYAPRLKPAAITFVDITEVGPFAICDKEMYITADAEKWIEETREQWDAIVSASAIQWFADIPRFLSQCHRRLKGGGVLAISTFTPGNLEELDALRPAPLIYPKASQLREWLERDFIDVNVEEDEIKVEFKSVREMLMHLKHTGVGGSAPSSGLSISGMSHLRSLTYRPVYITARKPRK